MATKKRFVVVTTTNRDVWYGEFAERTGDVVKLYAARHVFNWQPTNMDGLGGVAVAGLKTDSKVGPEVAQAEIGPVATVLDCTPEAVKSIAKCGWGRAR